MRRTLGLSSVVARQARLAAIMLLVVAGLSACGKSGRGSAPRRSRALSLGQADAVPLGIGIAAAERRLGPPASGPSLHGGYRCIYYDMAGQPPSDRFQLCFRSGRLIVVASAIG